MAETLHLTSCWLLFFSLGLPATTGFLGMAGVRGLSIIHYYWGQRTAMAATPAMASTLVTVTIIKSGPYPSFLALVELI